VRSFGSIILAACFFLALPIAAAAAVTSPAPAPMRIVSLAPSITEILFALGAGDQVVGVSQYDDYPPAIRALPRVGSFLTPNIEAIAALRPSLAIGLGISSNQREFHALSAMGCPTLMVEDDRYALIERSIRQIGDRIGRSEEASALCRKLDERVRSITERLHDLPMVPTLMLVGHQPIVAVGPGTYLDDLLKIVRADNIADNTLQQWPTVSIEYVVAMRPEVILDGEMGSEAGARAGFWDAYPTIPAVKNHRVYGYPQDPVLHPGPRVGDTLEILARLIHPDADSGAKR